MLRETVWRISSHRLNRSCVECASGVWTSVTINTAIPVAVSRSSTVMISKRWYTWSCSQWAKLQRAFAVTSNSLLPSATKLRRLCFYRHLSVHTGLGCLPQCMLGYHIPWSRHPLEQTSPWSRHPLGQTPPGADTPQSRHPRADTPLE